MITVFKEFPELQDFFGALLFGVLPEVSEGGGGDLWPQYF